MVCERERILLRRFVGHFLTTMGTFKSSSTAGGFLKFCNGGIRKYVRILLVLSIVIVVLSIVVVSVAMAYSKTLPDFALNDIPLTLGVGTSLMGMVMSTISPSDLLEEIDLDKKKKKKKNVMNNNKKPSTLRSKNNRKTKIKHHHKKKKPRRWRPRKLPPRSVRKLPRGKRFLRGLLRFFLGKK